MDYSYGENYNDINSNINNSDEMNNLNRNTTNIIIDEEITLISVILHALLFFFIVRCMYIGIIRIRARQFQNAQQPQNYIIHRPEETHPCYSYVISDKCEDTCSICIEPLLDSGKKIIRLHCGHMYHEECIQTWFKVKKICPLCNNSV